MAVQTDSQKSGIRKFVEVLPCADECPPLTFTVETREPETDIWHPRSLKTYYARLKILQDSVPIAAYKKPTYESSAKTEVNQWFQKDLLFDYVKDVTRQQSGRQSIHKRKVGLLRLCVRMSIQIQTFQGLFTTRRLLTKKTNNYRQRHKEHTVITNHPLAPSPAPILYNKRMHELPSAGSTWLSDISRRHSVESNSILTHFFSLLLTSLTLLPKQYYWQKCFFLNFWNHTVHNFAPTPFRIPKLSVNLKLKNSDTTHPGKIMIKRANSAKALQRDAVLSQTKRNY